MFVSSLTASSWLDCKDLENSANHDGLPDTVGNEIMDIVRELKPSYNDAFLEDCYDRLRHMQELQ